MIVPTVTPEMAARLLDSLRRAGGEFETIVVDNGTRSPALEQAAANVRGASVMRLDRNHGYSKAVNLAVARAQGDAIVLLNDDCVVHEGYVERIAAALDPAAGVVMAAGVLLDSHDQGLIDTAGMELDRTLLVFDYLNGEPVGLLDAPPPDPIGPCAAAAAFSADSFREVGGFDEELFAYWEDVDLVLRLRRAGGRCRLAPGARGVHEHSATLGSGSARKDYLVGFGRGYMLRKWGVLTPRRLPSLLARDLALSAGQAAVDRNLGGFRGRLAGLRATRARESYPAGELLPEPPTLASTLRRRWRRRARLRRRAD